MLFDEPFTPPMGKTMNAKRHALWITVIVFIAITAAHAVFLSPAQREFHADEVWSVWQLRGPQVDYTRDSNWPPLYYILLDGWQRLTGDDPITLRLLSLFIYLFGSACLYRAVRRIKNDNAARLTVLAFGALALTNYLTVQVRPYVLLYGLFPLTIWLTLRYFDHVTLRRGIALGLAMAAMFYTAYGSVGAYLMLGLYTLIVYRQAIWRWWLPGLVALIVAAPIVYQIVHLAVSRLQPLGAMALPPLIPGLVSFYQDDTGSSAIVWLILFLIAGLAILYRERLRRTQSIALLAWSLSPILIYLLNRYLGLFSPMYAWFITVGIVMWIGVGLAYLPGVGQVVVALILLVIAVTPYPIEPIAAQAFSLATSFEWLAKNVKWGDVLVIDPQWKDRYCHCIVPEQLDYYINLYFPQGWQIVDNPEGYRRVWYLKWDSLEDRSFEQRVEANRIAGPFVGPPETLFRLYEGPPDPTGIAFANGLRFLGVEFPDDKTDLLARRIGDTIHFRLWWSADHPIDQDYSVALHIYNNGQLAVQSDSAPALLDPSLPRQTSRWETGKYYLEDRVLTVPGDFATNAYPVYLVVYQPENGTRVSAPGQEQDHLLPITTLYVKSFRN